MIETGTYSSMLIELPLQAEEFTTSTAVPTPYKSVYWQGYITASNESSLSYIWPPNVTTQTGNFYKGYSPFHLSASTYKDRFDVHSFDVLCGFYEWSADNSSGTNDSPVTLTFVGRRDPYDGDGLPTRVIATYSIPYPGRYATTQKFTKIDLDKLTNSPGKFGGLYSFTMYATTGTYSYSVQFLVDNLVFSRSTKKENRKCRLPGGKELNVFVPSNFQFCTVY